MFLFETFYGHSTAVMDASKWNFLIASCCRVVDYYRTFVVIFVIALRFVFFCNIIVFVFIFISVKFDFGGKIIANGYETEISELTKQLTNGFAGLQNG